MRWGLIGLAFALMPAWATELQWYSAERAPAVIELFTSEGCSSCPPAERWLSSYKDHPDLFDTVIPMAFHVDYWDWIGWEDRFAKPEYSERQRRYVTAGHLSQRYTPGVMVNSEEFRAWFNGERTVSAPLEARGRLSVSVESNQLTANFANYPEDRRLTLNLAYLGNGLVSEVTRGENAGKTLTHNFVVLSSYRAHGQGQWTIDLPEPPDRGQTRTALVVWVSPFDEPRIIQALGGYLPDP